MKAKVIMATALIAFGAASASAQTMIVNLSNGSKMEFSTSEVTNVEFKEAEKKDDKPVTDDGLSANGHEYVDLGLPSGTLWAKCNIGAESPEEYGDYYAWGETEVKNAYSIDTYKYYTSSTENDADGYDIINKGYTKYVLESESKKTGYKGFYDDKSTLDEEDDVAHIKWGGDWRMPTRAELNELKDNCTWAWTEFKGVKGYKVTGTNGCYIFLPAAGCRSNSSFYFDGGSGYYWSSSLYGNMEFAFSMDLFSGEVSSSFSNRLKGCSVRPVRTKESAPQSPATNDAVTSKISASYNGGSIMSSGNTINYGSKLNFYFNNNSDQEVYLTGIQLVNGETGVEGKNLLSSDVSVSAGESKGYTITVGLAGIESPICRFTYKYNNQSYTVEAKYKSFSFAKSRIEELVDE